jgi:puromycin-sensitive aminopeptidase
VLLLSVVYNRVFQQPTNMAATPSSSSERVLLPSNVKPSAYELHLTPDLSAFTFAGTVRIAVTTRGAGSERVQLHALDLVLVSGVEGADNAATGFEYDKSDETVTVTFARALPSDAATTLTFTYTGELNDKMAGFYRSKYTVEGGKEAYMATTQFEATDARRALPCWDEPAVKATFTVALTVPAHMEALSNMPVTSVTKDAGAGATHTFRFAPTPIMSTYLLAFCVGQFEYVEQRTAKTNVLMRVYTPLGKREQGRFALECGAKTLDYFSEYFGVAYPLPKCDMIAIADFAAGAMENWGLITYRMTALLIDAQNSGLASKQRVAYVVAHELAHQWFGNLVTMEWWKELWLNEGFATFVGVQAVAHLFPEWDMWTNFQTDYTNSALITDALASSHPIEVEVRSSAQIGEVFDVISYKKGAAVIRMINDLIGEPAMRQGLNIYLKRHQYSNAVTTDLWKALGEASGRDVAQFMARWTGVTGYPLVTVSREGADGVHVAQTRFFSNGTVEQNATGHWHVSLRVGAAGGAATVFALSSQSASAALAPDVAGAKWLKFNMGQASVCRVLYADDALLRALESAIRSRELPTIDRLAVQADAFALAVAGRLSTATALRVAMAYEHETELAVFSDLSSNLMHLYGAFANTTAKPGIEKAIQRAFGGIGTVLGWIPKADEKPLDGLLRAVALKTLAAVGHEPTVAEAKKLFAAYAAHKLSLAPDAGVAATLPVDLRSTVLYAAVKYGGAAEYAVARALYRLADSDEERIRLMHAMGATKNADLHKQTLDWSFTADVRNQDVYNVVGACAASNPQQTWQFVQDQWAEFDKRFGGGSFLLARMVQYATQGFATEEKALEIAAFFAAHPCPSAARTIDQSLETVRGKAAWISRDTAAVLNFLTEQKLM